MSANLKPRIDDDMKTAMRAQDKRKLDAIRLIRAAIKQREIDERGVDMNDALVLEILNKMLKQRRDSLSQYQAANRQDLAEQESFEIEVIQSYMPSQLSEAEVIAIIKEVIAATGASSAKDMGKVMAALKPKLQGRADIAAVSNKIKEMLK